LGGTISIIFLFVYLLIIAVFEKKKKEINEKMKVRTLNGAIGLINIVNLRIYGIVIVVGLLFVEWYKISE